MLGLGYFEFEKYGINFSWILSIYSGCGLDLGLGLEWSKIHQSVSNTKWITFHVTTLGVYRLGILQWWNMDRIQPSRTRLSQCFWDWLPHPLVGGPCESRLLCYAWDWELGLGQCFFYYKSLKIKSYPSTVDPQLVIPVTPPEIEERTTIARFWFLP